MMACSASQTLGPFFPAKFVEPYQADLLPLQSSLVIRGQLLELDDLPRWNALIEIWQADEAGHFPVASAGQPSSVPAFRHWGRCVTNGDGMFEFRTVKPGAYFDPYLRHLRAPHLLLSVSGSGLMNRLSTYLFFDGDPELQTDPVFAVVPAEQRASILLRPDTRGICQFRIVLRGPNETPFFAE